MKTFKVIVVELTQKRTEYFFEAKDSLMAKKRIQEAIKNGNEYDYAPKELSVSGIVEVESVIETDSMGLPL